MPARVLNSRDGLRVGLIAIALAFAGTLGLVAQAGAATQLGAPAPRTAALPANTTALQFGAVPPVTYRYSGTYGSSAIITRWSTYGSGGTYQLKLKVGSALATDEGIVRYEGPLETVSAFGTQEFPVRVRIFTGEGIGAYSPTGAPGFLQATPLPVGDIVILKGGDQLEPPGQAFGPWDGWTNPADIKKQPYRMNLAATVEPDADGDDFGDESQDKCLGVPGEVDGCEAPPPPPLTCKKGLEKVLTPAGPRCKKVKRKGKNRCGGKQGKGKKNGKGTKRAASASKNKKGKAKNGKGKKRCTKGKKGKGNGKKGKKGKKSKGR